MRAVDGAVYAIDRYTDGYSHLHTIADATPRGFCGSGLVEAVHDLFFNQIIDCTGAFTESDMTRIFITGGLGYYINIEKMQRIGMFEQFDKHRFDKLPNASLGGAKHFLFKNGQAEISRILSLVEHCSLESIQAFQNIFCEKMFFPF